MIDTDGYQIITLYKEFVNENMDKNWTYKKNNFIFERKNFYFFT